MILGSVVRDVARAQSVTHACAQTREMGILDTTRAVCLANVAGSCEGSGEEININTDTLIGGIGNFDTFYHEVEKAAVARQMTYTCDSAWRPESREEVAIRLFSMGHCLVGCNSNILECLQQVDITEIRNGNVSHTVENYMWLVNHCLWCARDNDVRWRASAEFQDYALAEKKKLPLGI